MRKMFLGIGLGVLLAGCSSPPIQAGDLGRRPDWSLRGADGTRVSAGDFDHRIVIVDFWASWCLPCRREIPGFKALQEKYRDRGLVIIGLSFDRDREIHDRWIKANELNYASYFVQTEEGKGEVAKFEKLVGPIEGFPTTLVINKEGTIVYKHVGYGSTEMFEEILKPLF